MNTNGGEALIRSLEMEGVEVIFGLPGGAILPVYDPILDSPIRHVLVRHEQGAGHMAEGYAHATGRPGVAMVTSGPGATNIVTPILDAFMDSVPMVVVTGQVPRPAIGTDAFQECDIVSVVRPLVKAAWQVQHVADIPAIVAEAVRTSTAGRPGPVLVDIPRDIQEAAWEPGAPSAPPPQSTALEPDPGAITAVVDELRRSRRPVLYVGGGVVSADASPCLRVLAERLRIPVVTTLMGKGAFPEDHELFFGWPGMHGAFWANLAIEHSDLLLAVGARFDDRVTGKLAQFAPNARVVHFDIDAGELGKLRIPDVAVPGCLGDTLPALCTRSEALGPLDTPEWIDQLRAWREQHPLAFDRRAPTLKPQRVIELVAEHGDQRELVWTTGVGQHQMWAMQYARCRAPRTFITSGGHGTMGFGLPAAIGAKAARPDATVVCIDGDGSFQMTMQEIATSVSESLPVVVVILNNGHLGMVQQWQTMYFDERLSHVDLTQTLPDYAALARALGAVGTTVTDEAALRAALDEAVGGERTTVIDARVERFERCYPMIPPGARAADMVEWPGVGAS